MSAGSKSCDGLDEATCAVMETSMLEEEGYFNPPTSSGAGVSETGGKKQLESLCRVCANTSDYFIPIFEGEGVEHQLDMKIQKHLPIQVLETDGLPAQVCYQCASTLIAWHDLVTACVEADKKLHQLLQEEEDEEYEDREEKVIEFFNEPPVDSDGGDEFNEPSTSAAVVKVKQSSPPQKRRTTGKGKQQQRKAQVENASSVSDAKNNTVPVVSKEACASLKGVVESASSTERSQETNSYNDASASAECCSVWLVTESEREQFLFDMINETNNDGSLEDDINSTENQCWESCSVLANEYTRCKSRKINDDAGSGIAENVNMDRKNNCCVKGYTNVPDVLVTMCNEVIGGEQEHSTCELHSESKYSVLLNNNIGCTKDDDHEVIFEFECVTDKNAGSKICDLVCVQSVKSDNCKDLFETEIANSNEALKVEDIVYKSFEIPAFTADIIFQEVLTESEALEIETSVCDTETKNTDNSTNKTDNSCLEIRCERNGIDVSKAEFSQSEIENVNCNENVNIGAGNTSSIEVYHSGIENETVGKKMGLENCVTKSVELSASGIEDENNKKCGLKDSDSGTVKMCKSENEKIDEKLNLAVNEVDRTELSPSGNKNYENGKLSLADNEVGRVELSSSKKENDTNNEKLVLPGNEVGRVKLTPSGNENDTSNGKLSLAGSYAGIMELSPIKINDDTSNDRLGLVGSVTGEMVHSPNRIENEKSTDKLFLAGNDTGGEELSPDGREHQNSNGKPSMEGSDTDRIELLPSGIKDENSNEKHGLLVGEPGKIKHSSNRIENKNSNNKLCVASSDIIRMEDSPRRIENEGSNEKLTMKAVDQITNDISICSSDQICLNHKPKVEANFVMQHFGCISNVKTNTIFHRKKTKMPKISFIKKINGLDKIAVVSLKRINATLIRGYGKSTEKLKHDSACAVTTKRNGANSNVTPVESGDVIHLSEHTSTNEHEIDMPKCDASSKADHLDDVSQTRKQIRKTPKNVKCFICKFCSSQFKQYAVLCEHLKSCHNLRKELLKCELCGKEYSSIRCLAKHVLIHFDSRKLQLPCAFPFCSVKSILLLEYCSHLKKHFPYLMSCEIKGKKLARAKHFQRSVIPHHNGLGCECAFCGWFFKCKSDWTLHMQKHFNVAKQSKSNLRGKSQQEKQKKLCDICKVEFLSPVDFRQHLAVNKECQKHYQCIFCDKLYTNHKDMMSHKKIVHGDGREFYCSICGKYFSKKSVLISHVEFHFSCNFCGRKFLKKMHLRDHMKVHTVEKPFKCQKCPLCFDFLSSLLRHELDKHDTYG